MSNATRNAWDGLMVQLGVAPDRSKGLWVSLLAAYSEPHRHYHALSHIEALVTAFAPMRARFEEVDTTLLALFYHDIVYDPARSDNEEQSAQRLAADFPDSGRAQGHILATRHHAPTEDSDTNLVLDLDMGILGAPWPAYCAYAEGVFREYEPVYGREAYARGRAELFLKPTLAKPSIFLTPDFAIRENQARQNLQAELDRWTTGSFASAQKPV